MQKPWEVDPKALTAWTTESNRMAVGKQILDRLAVIKDDLATLDTLTELHIGTFNNCTFRPDISLEALRRFIFSTLSGERNELVAKFNELFSQPKESPTDAPGNTGRTGRRQRGGQGA